jgi:hypothetical protein
MKRFIVAVAVALVGAGVAVAAVTVREPAGPPTTASLVPAYVQAAKYWSAGSRAATQSPPTTSSLMDAYVQAARQWLP